MVFSIIDILVDEVFVEVSKHIAAQPDAEGMLKSQRL